MKKILALLLALTMVFALAACGGKEDPSNNNQNTSETQNTSNGAQENENNTSAETNENDEKEFNSLGEEVESWFRYAKDECDEDWAVIYFDGYDLVQTDPQGYDKYYIMVCPVDDYDTYEDAGAVDLTYGVYDSEGRPYRFGIEHWNVEKGKYTIVFAQMGGDVEIQFDAEKISDTEWKFDFENAKCPALESKYADASTSSTASENVAESGVTVGDGEWTSTKFPKPENCTIVGATDSFDGPVIMVEWADKDAFLAYVDVLVGMGEGSVEDNLSEMDGAAVYNSYNIHVAYSELDSAQNNILIY